MCNFCKKTAEITVATAPLTVNFIVKVQKSGAIKRSSDIQVIQTFDPDDFVNNGYTATCTFCGHPVDFSELKIDKSCALCDSSTKIKFCAFNNVYLCPTCTAKYLNYCRTCPFIDSCEIRSGENQC